jgi:CheY-like chemotaxis protein
MIKSQAYTVLLIEDDEIDRILVRTLLSSRAPGRFQLAEAPDLVRGLEMLRQHSYDLVLLDHTLPQLTSIQELRLVLGEQPTTSVIMHTGYIDSTVEAEALRMGVRQVVEKGDLDPLWSAIERVIEHTSEESPASTPGTAGGKSVLVVEDEPAVRRIIRISLELAGCIVYEAGNGEEALELMHRVGRGVDLVVADLMMPGIAGPTLALAVQRVRPELPVLFVSGAHDDDLLRALGRMPSEDEVLWKPFTPNQLVARVAKLVPAEISSATPETR